MAVHSQRPTSRAGSMRLLDVGEPGPGGVPSSRQALARFSENGLGWPQRSEPLNTMAAKAVERTHSGGGTDPAAETVSLTFGEEVGCE